MTGIERPLAWFLRRLPIRTRLQIPRVDDAHHPYEQQLPECRHAGSRQ